MASADDRAAFIRANTAILSTPHVPEIRLHLADEATALWQKTEDDLGQIGLPPPFWAFAWAGGQALARYVLDHPDVVRGKRILDLGSGSGLVAIATMMAGAKSATANEIDDFAYAAINLNAALNGVSLSILPGNIVGLSDWAGIAEASPDADPDLSVPCPFDCILAGDVCYEKTMSASIVPWLQVQVRRGVHVLIGDPDRAYLPSVGLRELVTYSVPVTRSLEDKEIKRTRVLRVL
jgi:predicted nicotinamide N-methyase